MALFAVLATTRRIATLSVMATTKKRTTAKPASRSNGRSASNGYSTATKPGRIRSRARREKIEALIERTTKDQGFSPEVEASFKDDAWGKRIVGS